MSQDKLVFLDIDGVMITHRWWAHRAAQGLSPDDSFGPESVQCLNAITDATGAQIVISSVRRKEHTMGDLRLLCASQGIRAEVLGVTPKYTIKDGSAPPLQRGEEIQEWLRHNDMGGAQIVILDDDGDMAHLSDRLVLTHMRNGLDAEHVPRAVEILNTPMREAPPFMGHHLYTFIPDPCWDVPRPLNLITEPDREPKIWELHYKT